MKCTWLRMTLALLFLSVSVSCRGRDTRVTPPDRSANVPITQGTPQSVRAFEQRATAAAKQWRPDAYMTGAQAIVPASRPDGTFTIRSRVTFHFSSKADTRHSYLVGFDSKEVLDAFEYSDAASPSDDLAIGSSDWPLDSLDTWQIVQANGGSALLEEYRQQTIDMRCALSLQRWNPPHTGPVLWHMGCMDAVTVKSFDFLIDAQTGKIVDKRAQ